MTKGRLNPPEILINLSGILTNFLRNLSSFVTGNSDQADPNDLCFNKNLILLSFKK